MVVSKKKKSKIKHCIFYQLRNNENLRKQFQSVLLSHRSPKTLVKITYVCVLLCNSLCLMQYISRKKYWKYSTTRTDFFFKLFKIIDICPPHIISNSLTDRSEFFQFIVVRPTRKNILTQILSNIIRNWTQ